MKVHVEIGKCCPPKLSIWKIPTNLLTYSDSINNYQNTCNTVLSRSHKEKVTSYGTKKYLLILNLKNQLKLLIRYTENTYWAISMLEKFKISTIDIENLTLMISAVPLWKQNIFLNFLRAWSLKTERWNE